MEKEMRTLDQRTIRVVTYFCMALPALVTTTGPILSFNIKGCGSCASNCLKFIAILMFLGGVYLALRMDMLNESSLIFFSLALISVAPVLTVRLLALFVHGPEMRKFSLKATMNQQYNQSIKVYSGQQPLTTFQGQKTFRVVTPQLVFVIIISLWSREVPQTGIMSMLSSIIMIGKSSTESYLTFAFGSKNLLRDASLLRQLFLFASTTPVFILSAVFWIGSFSLMYAWDHILTTTIILPIASSSFLIFFLFLKVRGHVRDLTMRNIFKSYLNEHVSISFGGSPRKRAVPTLADRNGRLAFCSLLLIPHPDLCLPNGRELVPSHHPDP